MQSIAQEAFGGCGLIKKAEFSGDAADIYGNGEEGASFPDGCVVNIPAGGKDLRKEWESAAQQQAAASDGDTQAKDQPYYWTQSLTERDYYGNAGFADVALKFDGVKIIVSVNGRQLNEYGYYADSNDEEQIVHTNGLFCKEGWINELRYSKGYRSDDRLYATITKDDGTAVEVVFHTGSEEKLYIRKNDNDTYPVIVDFIDEAPLN